MHVLVITPQTWNISIRTSVCKLCQDQTARYFCPSPRSLCQIRESQCHNFLQCLGYKTDSTIRLILTNYCLRPCMLSGMRAKKLSIVATEGTRHRKLSDLERKYTKFWLFISVSWSIDILYLCHTKRPIRYSPHSYSLDIYSTLTTLQQNLRICGVRSRH